MFTNEPVVQVREADIYQAKQLILHQVQFEVAKGEFVFVIGPTGSGKSSLLKTLYADLPIQNGFVSVAGFPLNGIQEKKIPFLRRRLGIIFQDFQLFMDRNVGENLWFVLQATGWKDRTKMRARISDVLMQVGLGSSEKKMPHQLSGGEQQRVVIARALLNEPVVVIADEPTGNLDPEVSEGIMRIFHQINRSGTAVMMATHSYDLIKKFPARILKCYHHELIDSEKVTEQLIQENDL